jgi:hypothetical protein
MSRGGMVKLHLALKIAICASARTAQNGELMPLRATYASIGGAFAPLWIAQDKGVFNKYGLAVDLRYMLSATGTQAAFVRQYGYRQSRHRAYRSRPWACEGRFHYWHMPQAKGDINLEAVHR